MSSHKSSYSFLFFYNFAIVGIPKSSLIGLTTSRSSVVATVSAPSSGPSSTSSVSCETKQENYIKSQIYITALTSFGPESRIPLAPARPKCNSILHLFGEWLFEAAFLGCDLQHSK